ncbi:acetate--CoA ligase [bacterium]|nr:acetate--CoA ligase [bacterium]
MAEAGLETLLRETRRFPPPSQFGERAKVSSAAEYERLYRRSIDDPEGFWADVARELTWTAPWHRVLDWKPPHAQWFVGGKTNLSWNCLDRHLSTWRKNKAAILWEGEPGETRTLTYLQLHREVSKFAHVLTHLGVVAGDRVAIYMPMVPEAAIAMLACARIGAVHSVVFGGFSSSALVDRINDASAKIAITSDGSWRRGKIVPLKATLDEALPRCPSVEHVIVHRRTGAQVPLVRGRDFWWDELMDTARDDVKAAELDAEHPLFILYTSGTTGKPKGILHTTGGYMVGTYLTTKLVFDLRDEDTFWCTADVGWVTGHSYVVYGPLLNGATTLMYEGAPNHPDPGRLWDMVERHKVSIFYTAPTAIRAFVKWGDGWVTRRDLGSLRLLGSVGEPINPEAWMWYHKVVGGGRCPIVDTWWQTETGSIMITPLPGAITTKPGSATRPFFGVAAEVVDEQGKPVPPGKGGFLVIKRPWPSMLRTLWNDDPRYREAYWSKVPGVYFTGDGAHKDADGDFWIVGRIDDVVNVSGHRLGTAEVESALVSHSQVAEAAVVGYPHEMKGQAVAAFVTLRSAPRDVKLLRTELAETVAKAIGSFARPEQIHLTDSLPKTRSGKIMRRLLRDIAAGKETTGDTTTL